MTFTGNTASATGATAQVSGGAIGGVSSITLGYGSAFTNNRATATSGATAFGGAIDGLNGAIITSPAGIGGAPVLFNHNSATNGGGAIRAGAAVVLGSSSFVGNTVTGAGVATDGGGAILLQGNSSANLSGVTLAQNSMTGTAGGGGAIAAVTGGAASLVLTNSTLSANTARTGGGVFIGSGAAATINVSTLFTNTATGNGGNIADASGSLSLFGSIVAGGVAAGGADISYTAGTFTDLGSNVVQTTAGGVPSFDISDVIAAPQLGALSGAVPQVMVPATGSPAIDLVPSMPCIGIATVDELGRIRPNGVGCDAGAYEK